MRSKKLPPETLKQLVEASFARWRERAAFTSPGATQRAPGGASQAGGA
jgi:hypothetical protein